MRWRTAGIALSCLLSVSGARGAEPGESGMDDREKLARDWVEVSEESDGAKIVLRPAGRAIPPSRGGRRHLQLSASGGVRSLGAGPADALETKGQGGWSVKGDTLHLELGGWQGDYQIEQVSDDILVLRRR